MKKPVIAFIVIGIALFIFSVRIITTSYKKLDQANKEYDTAVKEVEVAQQKYDTAVEKYSKAVKDYIKVVETCDVCGSKDDIHICSDASTIAWTSSAAWIEPAFVVTANRDGTWEINDGRKGSGPIVAPDGICWVWSASRVTENIWISQTGWIAEHRHLSQPVTFSCKECAKWMESHR